MQAIRRYGAKKKKRQQRNDFVCVEPVRRSLYDIMLENMQVLQRNVYVHRIIYFGTHSFPANDLDSIGKHFRTNIDQVNSMYCEEFLTGFLLHYTRHFIHVLDGPEDGIKKHLDLLFSTKETSDHLETVKVLVVYHNINQRFFNTWLETFARPPKLLQKIKSDTDATDARSMILMCITKMYKLAYHLKTSEEESQLEVQHSSLPSTRKHPSFQDDPQPIRASVLPGTGLVSDQKISSHAQGGGRSSMSRYQSAIPELQLMEFLVDTPHTLDIEDYMKCYGSVPLLYTYADVCWPVITDFIPRNIFDAEYDPVADVFDPIVPSETEFTNTVQ